MPFSRRSLLTQLKYLKHKKTYPPSHICPFCDLQHLRTRVVNINEGSFRVVTNDFPYAFWEGTRLLEHLLIVPQRHIASLAEMNEVEQDDLIRCIIAYESKGYTFYLRAATDPTRSVTHVHGHFLKLKPKRSVLQ